MNKEFSNKQLNELFYGKLHWCCGRPDQVLESIYEILNISKNFHNHNVSSTNCYDSGCIQFMWHALNDADLLEHGCGVGGSWLTEKGEILLAMLDKYGVEKVCEMVEEGGNGY